jgi:heptose-I-phosphate ethanolaminephosphotransferase
MKSQPASTLRYVTVLLLGLFCIQLAEYFLSGFSQFRTLNFLENSLFLVAILIISSFFRSIIKRIFYAVFVFVLLVEGFYFLTFGAPFPSSAVFIAFDTSPTEVQEFFSYNYSHKLAVYFLIVLTITISMWSFFKNTAFTVFKRNILFFISVLAIVFLTSIRQQNFPFIFVKGALQYLQIYTLLDADSSNKKGNFTNLVYEPNSEELLYVVIVGESTSRAHFGLYNYERSTTPKLASIKNELIKYNDVISGQTYTIGSLTRALSFDNNSKKGNNIIQLLNAAEYKTFWISNQTPVGLYETLVTKIAKTSDNLFFSNTIPNTGAYPFDEILFPTFEQALNDSANKKVIFVHLMGAHGNYKLRYPPEFQHFYDKNANSKQAIVNHYDNAVVYTDYMIYEIIQRVKKQKVKSFVLYFSDHGEEVYDSIDFAGHTPNQLISKNMLEIPFLLWQSKEYKQEKLLEMDTSRKYVLDDLSHSIADLCRVNALEVHLSKSIFSSHFQETPRIVLDTFNFDRRFY